MISTMAVSRLLGRCLNSVHLSTHATFPSLRHPPLKHARVSVPKLHAKPRNFYDTRCELSQVVEVARGSEEDTDLSFRLESEPGLSRSKVTLQRPKDFFPKKGQDLELVCESLAYKGLGVCKVVETGFVVFCERALPGERLVARIIKKRKGFAEVKFISAHSRLQIMEL